MDEEDIRARDPHHFGLVRVHMPLLGRMNKNKGKRRASTAMEELKRMWMWRKEAGRGTPRRDERKGSGTCSDRRPFSAHPRHSETLRDGSHETARVTRGREWWPLPPFTCAISIGAPSALTSLSNTHTLNGPLNRFGAL